MDELAYLRKNKHLIAKDHQDPEKLKIVVHADLETLDALEDYLTEIMDLDITWTETISSTSWALTFLNPTQDVINKVAIALDNIGIPNP